MPLNHLTSQIKVKLYAGVSVIIFQNGSKHLELLMHFHKRNSHSCIVEQQSVHIFRKMLAQRFWQSNVDTKNKTQIL